MRLFAVSIFSILFRFIVSSTVLESQEVPAHSSSVGFLTHRRYLDSSGVSFLNAAQVHQRKLEQQRQLNKFDWNVEPEPEYPRLSNDRTMAVEFLYTYSGEITQDKSLEVSLRKSDCLSFSDTEAGGLSWNETLYEQDRRYSVFVNVDKALIRESDYYSQDDAISAEITFCVRVDYRYKNDSINFHETRMTVIVDLTSGFELSQIVVDRDIADKVDAEASINCEVYEYFCDEQYEPYEGPYSQGSILRACLVSKGQYHIRNVREARIDQDSDYDGEWDVHDDIVTDYIPDPFTRISCSLGRCMVKTQLKSKYFSQPRQNNNVTLSGVVTCGFGRSPQLSAGCSTPKLPVAQNSTFVTYPVRVALNDEDTSDAFESVVLEYATVSNSGRAPEIQFGATPDEVNFDYQLGKITLTGNDELIGVAMKSLQIRPQDVDDISYKITATVVDLDGRRVSVVEECVIPVKTTVETSVVLAVPSSVTGAEGEKIPLKIEVDVWDGVQELIGPVTVYLEIDTNADGTTSTIWANSERQYDYKSDGWLRVDAALADSVEVQAHSHYSGIFTMTARVVLVEGSDPDAVVFVSSTREVTVNVEPRADAVNPVISIALEDAGPIPFGAKIASVGHNMLKDRGVGHGNNAEGETISEMRIVVPADSDNVTYTMSGEYVPLTEGTLDGTNTARVSLRKTGGKRTYKISSTHYENIFGQSQLSRRQAEDDILSTVSTFAVAIGPSHTDLDGDIAVTITTLDANIGIEDTKETTFNPLLIQAVADTPGIQVMRTTDIGVEDDGNFIPLSIATFPSADQDGSETISVKITVPHDSAGPIGEIKEMPGPAIPGVSLSDAEDGVYLVTSTAGLDSLNEVLGAGVAFHPRPNFAGYFVGTSGIRVDVISTEFAAGQQVATKTAVATDYINIVLKPVLDTTVVEVKGNAAGKEDTPVPVPISVALGDPDGSETFVMSIESINLPPGTVLRGADGPLQPEEADGRYNLSAEDVASLTLQPPLHWSSALPSQGDITLLTTTHTTEFGLDEVSSVYLEISVPIEGVADKPNARTILVPGAEDQPYDIGSAVVASGALSDILVDQDGSENLYLFIQGLPDSVSPTSSAGEINYLGNKKYQIDEEAISTLQLPPLAHYSGTEPYPDLKIRATSQEIDGNQANSDWWTVNFEIVPVVDGFGGSWSARTRVSEGDLEAGRAVISFSSVENQRLVDLDGSELVLGYEFNFTSMIDDAGIGLHIADNLSVSSLDRVLSDFLVGTYSFDSKTNVVTVLREDVADLALQPQLFLDSNQDFSIPVHVLVRDRAVISGEFVDSEGSVPGTFYIHLSGTADTPTAYARSTSGTASERIALTMGGETTDTDEALGRSVSESVYYVVQYLNPAMNRVRWAFTNEAGEVIGFNNGDSSWILHPPDLADIHLYAPIIGDVDQTLQFKLTSIAVENDFGNSATNSTVFDVVVTDGPREGPGVAPFDPTLKIGNHSGREDVEIQLDVSAAADPDDQTNPKITIVVSNIPEGAELKGAILNPITQKYVARAEDIEAGLVRISPPADFSGSLTLTVEAVATNEWALSTTSGERNVTLALDPVADGAHIAFSATKNNSQPLDPEEWTPPASNFELKLRGRCSSPGHTERLKQCVLRCPLHETAVVRFGQDGPFLFTSERPSNSTFDLPSGLVLKRGAGDCYESPQHTAATGRFVVLCPLDEESSNHGGYDGNLKLSSDVSDDELTISGVMIWAWRGKALFFYFPYGDLDRVNAVLPPDSEINVEHSFSAPGGERFNVERVMHWNWHTNDLYFYVDPFEYSAESCNFAASDFSAMFEPEYKINVEIYGQPVVREDQDFAVSVSLNELDVDGSEEIGNTTYVHLGGGATLLGDYSMVSSNDPDKTVLGTSVAEYFRIPSKDLSNLPVRPPENWHGDIKVHVVSTVFEPLDDADGDHIKLAQSSTKITVVPVADPPQVAVPSTPIMGREDTSILIGSDLEVRLLDTVKTNGAESLSIVLSGVPKDSVLSSGWNNGDGSWSIPSGILPSLQIMPPRNFAGTMNLTLTGIAVERSRGYSEASTSKDFSVVVSPVADPFLIVAEDTVIGSGNSTDQVSLNLNIRLMDTRGKLDGELPPERLALRFDNVPAGLRVWSNTGGTIVDLGSGSYSFSGSEEQANELMLLRSGPDLNSTNSGAETNEYRIDITGVTSDSGAVLATPIEDSFVLFVESSAESTVFVAGIEVRGDNVTGTSGNDILRGTDSDDTIDGKEGNDIIQGGPGSDLLTGGTGRDLFYWTRSDLAAGSIDRITDFSNGVGGDVLDLTGLITVANWEALAGEGPIPPPEMLIRDYVELKQNADGTTVSVDVFGKFVDVVTLIGVTDLSLETMLVEGNIMI